MTDAGRVSGDLGPIVAEARGWAADCGYRAFPDTVAGTRDVLARVTRVYDGGLYAFALATAVLCEETNREVAA